MKSNARRYGAGSAIHHCTCCSVRLACKSGSAQHTRLPSKGRTDAQRQPARERRADGVGVEEDIVPALFVPEAALRPVWAGRCGANIRFPVGGGRSVASVLGRYTEVGRRTFGAVARSPRVACEHKQPTAALMFAQDMLPGYQWLCARACECVCVCAADRWPHCYAELTGGGRKCVDVRSNRGRSRSCFRSARAACTESRRLTGLSTVRAINAPQHAPVYRCTSRALHGVLAAT